MTKRNKGEVIFTSCLERKVDTFYLDIDYSPLEVTTLRHMNSNINEKPS